MQRPFPEVGLDHSPGGTGLHSRRKSALPGALGLRNWFSRVSDSMHDVFGSSADDDDSGPDRLTRLASTPKFG